MSVELWLRAWHVVAMVAWFSGLFYLPRLFVYHADTTDTLGIERFWVMERRLYYGIVWPAGLATTVLGLSLLVRGWSVYQHQAWMAWKLVAVVVLWAHHLGCGYYLRRFREGNNQRSSVFFRWFNEVPTLVLVAVVLLVELKPVW